MKNNKRIRDKRDVGRDWRDNGIGKRKSQRVKGSELKMPEGRERQTISQLPVSDFKSQILSSSSMMSSAAFWPE